MNKKIEDFDLEAEFLQACKYNNLDIVKSLSKKIKNFNFFCKEPLRLAASNGHLEIIKYLLTSSDFDVKPEWIDVDVCFIEACKYGKLDIIEYLLTSHELSSKANIQARGQSGLKMAIKYDHLPVVEYLLISPKLDAHLNINCIDLLSIKCSDDMRSWLHSFEKSYNQADTLSQQYQSKAEKKKIIL